MQQKIEFKDDSMATKMNSKMNPWQKKVNLKMNPRQQKVKLSPAQPIIRNKYPSVKKTNFQLFIDGDLFPNALLYLVQLTTTQYTSHNTQSCDNYKAGQCSQVYRINKDTQQFVRCNMTLINLNLSGLFYVVKFQILPLLKKLKM